MTSARGVVLGLVLAAGPVGAAHAQAPWPGESQAEAIRPSDAPQVPLPTPLNVVQQQCIAEFAALRSKVEKTGMAAKAGAEKRVSRKELCKLVTAYSAAETNWLTYAETNMTKCGIPDHIVTQVKTVHAKTAEGQIKLCAAGFSPAGLRENNLDYGFGPPDYGFGPPTQPIDLPPKFLPRFSGR
jgi:hypothetical protein